MASFGDLNIPASSNRVELSQRIHHAKNLGYNFIAVNRVVTGNLQPNEHKCTFKPLDIENDNGNDGLLVLGKKSFKQYSRLTVVLDSPNQMHSLVIYMEKIIGVTKLLIYRTFRIQEVLLLKVMIYL